MTYLGLVLGAFILGLFVEHGLDKIAKELESISHRIR